MRDHEPRESRSTPIIFTRRRLGYLIAAGALPLWTFAASSTYAQPTPPVRPAPTATRTAIPNSDIKDLQSRVNDIAKAVDQNNRDSTDAVRISRDNATAIAIIRPTLNALIKREIPDAKSPTIVDVAIGTVKGIWEKPIPTIPVLAAVGVFFAYRRGYSKRPRGGAGHEDKGGHGAAGGHH